jgi:hypothetical protein
MKFLTILLLLLSNVCFAQTFTFNQGGPASKNYYEEIPYENINGKIIIEGEIAGKKHRFLFDTGAPVALSKELAAELEGKILHKMVIGDAYLHSDSVMVVEVNDIKLGGITFDHIPAITLFPEFYKCLNVDGVIGSNLLRNSIVSIVGNKHIIIFTDQKSKLKLNAKNSTPLISNQGPQSDPRITIIMKGKINVSVNIPFDTGDKNFMRVSDQMISGLKQYALFDTLATGYGADNLSAMGLQGAGNKYLFKTSPILIGNGNFNNLIVESNKDAIPAMGSKLLDYGTVTLDFINSKFYFDAYETSNDLGEKQWPFKPTFASGKFVVGVVWGKAAGVLKQGDEILAVDDADCSKLTLCELINNKSIMDGKETAVLTIKDAQGNIKKVTVKKE